NPSTPSTTGVLNLTPGWHDIEIRFGHATGSAGPVTGNGWSSSFGFGYSTIGSTSTSGGAYLPLLDGGDGSFLQFLAGMGIFKDGTGTLPLTNGNNDFQGPVQAHAGAFHLQLGGLPQTLNGQQQVAVNGIVAAFTDADPTRNAGRYSATID